MTINQIQLSLKISYLTSKTDQDGTISQLLTFANVICCSRLPLLVILSILSSHPLVQQFINRHIFHSIKEANWLINKGMCDLLFDVFKYLLLRKTVVLKKVNFSERKFEEMH